MTLVWRPGILYDADALAYMELVKAADAAAGQTGGLEQGVVDAINDFVVGCKTDGIWSAIKASCILAGARTLSGALTPLTGTAPTSFNFVDANYDRKIGLQGDGSTKYLNSGFNNNLTSLDNVHLSFYPTQITSGSIGVGGGGTSGATHFVSGGARNRNSSSAAYTYQLNALIGSSRDNNLNFILRSANSTSTVNIASTGQNLIDGNHYVFARNELPAPGQFSSGRLAFYSIGESLPDGPTKTGLELLDERVSALITAIGAAIP